MFLFYYFFLTSLLSLALTTTGESDFANKNFLFPSIVRGATCGSIAYKSPNENLTVTIPFRYPK